MQYILENKEWIFSGIGVAIVLFFGKVVIGFLTPETNRKSQKSGNNSINIQSDGDVHIGEKLNDK
tara:strand:- start:1902 stop:2096 length:195 start_codon:yes stop_codon:yes gene_type:complete